MDLVNWEDRSTEAWAFGKDLILDSRGRPVKQNKSLVRNLKFNVLIFKIDFLKLFWFGGIYSRLNDGLNLREIK